MAQGSNIGNNDRLRSSKLLWAFYWVFILASIALCVRITYLKVLWEPEPVTAHYFRPKNEKNIIKPERGAIIDHNGKILAITTPLYDIFMDCAVQKTTKKGKTAGEERKEYIGHYRSLSQAVKAYVRDRFNSETQDLEISLMDAVKRLEAINNDAIARFGL